MTTTIRTGLASCLISLALFACGGGGGGDRAPGVEPGPTPPDGPVTPPPPVLPSDSIDAAQLTSSDTVQANIVAIRFDSPPTVSFTLVANKLQRVTGLDNSALRASFVKLVDGTEFDTSDWESLINRSEDPVCRSASDVSASANQCTSFTSTTDPDAIPDSARKVQDPVATGKVARNYATTESGGELVLNQDGSWSYTMVTNPGDPSTLGETHRICFQFSLEARTNNACIDFVPEDLVNSAIGERATSLDQGFYQNYPGRQVVATATCNTCHENLALHGGGRTEMDYCVSCHNPDSTDANSENSVDFKIMAHRIHRGASLPSVEDGTPYKIWGFSNSEHDYSDIIYPGVINNCARCHAGQEDVDYAEINDLPAPTAVLTTDGHNWVTYGGRVACESCHDDKLRHGGGGEQPCMNCHIEGGRAKGPQQAHRNLVAEASTNFEARILEISNTAPGQNPAVRFSIVNPNNNNSSYNILSDPEWTQGGGASGGASRLAVTVAWSTSDYTNTGNAGSKPEDSSGASSVSINALASASSNGDGSFSVTSPVAIPDGSLAPDIAASGSGAVTIEGHPVVNLDTADEPSQVPLTNVVEYFGITDPRPVPRRESAVLDNCLDCHQSLSLHDGNRTDKLEGCVTCHNPRNTDRSVREVASQPPTDGKAEESLDFKTMIHGIHAAAFREAPLQIVGFGGFSTHVYDLQHVQYPGRLSNCQTCHGSRGYQLPLEPEVLATSVGTGTDIIDPGDDLLTTPVTAVCSSCHDSAASKQHMQSQGGLFAAPYATATGAIETCDVCHRGSASASVETVHNR
jgi:OmcA/MtrC family decaheme c-type cytochrome